jgi:hypothetical protein
MTQRNLTDLFGPPQANCRWPGGGLAEEGKPLGGGAGGGARPAAPGSQAESCHSNHCDAIRTIAAGGALQQLLLHPSVVPFEQVFRRQPSPGIYRATPTKTFTFEVGAFTVPNNMMLAVAEWNFHVYRFSGVYAGESVLIDGGLCSLNIGTDFNVDQMRLGNTVFELIPINPQTAQAAFSPVQTGGTTFGAGSINPVPVTNNAGGIPTPYGLSNLIGSMNQQSAFVQGAGIGSALMPYTDRAVQGPSRMPFTYYARESQAVQLRVSVYRQLRIPISYFETRIMGYLLPINTLLELQKAMAPCNTGGI